MSRMNISSLCKKAGCKFRKTLRSVRGDGYIDVVVAVLVSMMLIVLTLNIFSFYTLHQDLDYYAKEMVEVACAEGRTNGEVASRASELSKELDIYPSYTWTADYMSPTYNRKVQLGEPMEITVRYTTYVRGVGIFKIPVTLTVTHSGLSEKYWK